VASNTILRRLAGERSRQRRHSEETRLRMRELAGGCRTQTALHLPPVRVPTGSLGELSPGAILRLDLPARTRAQFRAGGVLLFSAAPVGQSDHRAAQLLASSEAKK
jgi:flagellar motor switch protein FliM